MKTESHSINDVLSRNVTSFYIPPFQRAYAWGKPEIERYFNDVNRIINSELDNDQKDKLEHFFGTLVIKEENEGFARKSIVVDGQQRLTTTLLFLIALRDIATDENIKNHITDNYLKNNSSTFEDKIKLKQVTKDWESYKALVNKEQVPLGIISNAYLLFTRLINGRMNFIPGLKIEHFLAAIKKMNVAVIFLDERPFKGEDPQIIFETLNSLGKPLTLSDLVRNFVLLNMNSDNQSKVYEDIWYPKIEAILTENTSSFFRDYLQFKTASPYKVVSDNNTKELYQFFKNFVEENFCTHSDFINDIVRYVKWYFFIITENYLDNLSLNSYKNIEIKELLRNIFHDIKAEAFKPFVLGLIEYHQNGVNDIKLNDDQLISILKVIRTYLIRRRILKLTQGENKNIVTLIKKFEELAKEKYTIYEILCDLSYRLRFPNNDEIRKILLMLDLYEEAKQYSKFILGKIEENNTKVAVDFRNPKITIEHIMPQKLNEIWERELGDDYESIHKPYLHNIGNLILTEFNSEIGNRPFIEKKEKLNTSSLNYRLTIISKDQWNLKSMQEHQENMIDWFLATFPLPDEYKTTSNWNTGIAESTVFSPLDSDAGEIAEGNKPSEMCIFGNVIKVKTWQDVFLKFMEFAKNNKTIDFDYILENQEELFNKERLITKWSNFKHRVEERNDLTTRFKTIKGKKWNEVNNLNDDELFFHINISAFTCMMRIANIMNKFNLTEKDIFISLK